MAQIIVHGARGRMGQRVCALLRKGGADAPSCALAAALDRDDALTKSTRGDVIIDFTSSDGAVRAARLAAERSIPLLTGTTALDAEAVSALEAAARDVPVLLAPNASLGVAVLKRIAAQALQWLGDGWDVDIVEMHHKTKRDAPSGTALALREALERPTGRPIPDERVHSVRAGQLVGEHHVQLVGPMERLTLSHETFHRDVFALGAIRAACWLIGRPPGRYSIEHALGMAD